MRCLKITHGREKNEGKLIIEVDESSSFRTPTLGRCPTLIPKRMFLLYWAQGLCLVTLECGLLTGWDVSLGEFFTNSKRHFICDSTRCANSSTIEILNFFSLLSGLYLLGEFFLWLDTSSLLSFHVVWSAQILSLDKHSLLGETSWMTLVLQNLDKIVETRKKGLKF